MIKEKIYNPNVLWFSAHEMTADQKAALGDVGEIDQVNKTINSAFELKDEIDSHDIIAIVAPVQLQQQFIKLAGDKPVIMAKSNRVPVIDQETGEQAKDPSTGDPAFKFQFDKWEQIEAINVQMKDYIPEQTTEKQNVLWFSRHEMSEAQKDALGDVGGITQVNKTIKNAYEIQNEIKAADVVAIVAPINIQQQVLKIAESRPVIMARNDRVPRIDEKTGEQMIDPKTNRPVFDFHFNKWEQLESIEIKKKDFEPVKAEQEVEHSEPGNESKGADAFKAEYDRVMNETVGVERLESLTALLGDMKKAQRENPDPSSLFAIANVQEAAENSFVETAVSENLGYWDENSKGVSTFMVRDELAKACPEAYVYCCGESALREVQEKITGHENEQEKIDPSDDDGLH